VDIQFLHLLKWSYDFCPSLLTFIE
jgi:hypothetical protein